jgi:FKBP-type peptidyl-prolyl cis-trans isomerase
LRIHKGPKGKLYDNSFKDSQPFSFVLENDNVVDGLHQGMKVIHTEEHAFIEIPYSLAYGAKGMVDLVPKKHRYCLRCAHIEHRIVDNRA